MKFRELRADEIDCRVQTVTKKGFSILLYKDARCDMNILDETVGALNWKREHTRDNANCIVSIWDKDKEQWISKEDTGTESFTEKEKGLASDSFKRACFNWGIGRELYNAPFIWVSDKSYIQEENGKLKIKSSFVVKSIKIENYKIIALEIADAKGNVVFKTGVNIEKKVEKKPEVTREQMLKEIPKLLQDKEIDYFEKILKYFKLPEDTTISGLNDKQLQQVYKSLVKK